MRRELAILLVALGGCGAVSVEQPLTGADGGAKDLRGSGEVEDAAAQPFEVNDTRIAPLDAGFDSQPPPPFDAGVELGPEAPPSGPEPCPGATGTAAAQRCKDVGGVRCATGCQDTTNHPQPGQAAACVEPGAPWTGGIPVLCVADCSSCPP